MCQSLGLQSVPLDILIHLFIPLLMKRIVEAITHAGIAIALRLLLWLGISEDVKYVSSDGGFEYQETFKSGWSVRGSFELYKFLRNDPNLILYRTTRLNPFKPLNIFRLRYPYNDSIHANPSDMSGELRKKAIEEYLPSLPSPLSVDGIRLFYYNQYNRNKVSIFGIYQEKVFGLLLRSDPRNSVCLDFATWWSSRNIDTNDPAWERIWVIVNMNRQTLIQ